jgi:hypothetical protein
MEPFSQADLLRNCGVSISREPVQITPVLETVFLVTASENAFRLAAYELRRPSPSSQAAIILTTQA